MKFNLIHVLWLAVFFSCKRNERNANPVTPGTAVYALTTNKAAYKPGESVSFTLNAVPAEAGIRYRYLDQVIAASSLNAPTWTWQPPATDFKGYLVEVYGKEGAKERTLASIAVDVSSDWSRFPRYGFLSEFGEMSETRMDEIMKNLNRHHINGIQFYDWHEKHHKPMAGTVASPSAQWKDIANRDLLRSTVQGYIDRAHAYGMQAMFYNLCYGALSDGQLDGVQPAWYMYRDASHTTKDGFILPKPPFRSDIFFVDPSNTAWQQYIAERNRELYQVYNFDGYHIDQVGNRDGTLYDYKGRPIDLVGGFKSFIQAVKKEAPEKKLVMNAVNQYGQESNIAASPVDFLYTEVWTGHEGYKDLATVIQNNHAWSGGKSTVLAAYLNYDMAAQPGTFNTPGVLLANAVIFAFGGSHIELGEHMLGKEYFPNNNLKMNDDLQKAMVHYYDFLTAYENLLRDSGSFNTVSVSCTNGKMDVGAWPPVTGKVACQGKLVDGRQVVHFINLANATSFDWRDAQGKQPVPVTIADAAIEIVYNGTAKKVWVASPDLNGGVPASLSFQQSGNKVRFTLPQLKYWNMVVIE